MVDLITKIDIIEVKGKGMKLKYKNGKGQNITTGFFHDYLDSYQFIQALMTRHAEACENLKLNKMIAY